MKIVLSILVFIIIYSSNVIIGQNIWYMKNTATDFGDINSWTSNSNGGAGAAPTDFTNSGDEWHVKNVPGGVATLTTDMSSAGTASNQIADPSKIVVENGMELVFTGNGTLQDALIDVNSGAKVTLNSSNPALYIPDNIDINSTFELNVNGAYLVGSIVNPPPTFLGYGKVLINNDAFLYGSCDIRNTLTVNPTFIFNLPASTDLTLSATPPIVCSGSLQGNYNALGMPVANQSSSLHISGGTGGNIKFINTSNNFRLHLIDINLTNANDVIVFDNAPYVFGPSSASAGLVVNKGFIDISGITYTVFANTNIQFPVNSLNGGIKSTSPSTLQVNANGKVNRFGSGNNLFALHSPSDEIGLISLNSNSMLNPLGIASAGNIGTLSITQGSFAFGQTAAAVVNNTLSTVNGGGLLFNGNTGVTNMNTVTVSGGTLNMSGTAVLNATLTECNTAAGQLISSNTPQLNANTLSLTAGQSAFAGGTQTFTDAIVTDATLGISAGAISIATLTVNHANAQVNASPTTISMDTVFIPLANAVNLSPSASGNYKFISITDAPVSIGGTGSFNVANKLLLNNNNNAQVTLNGGAAVLDSLFAFAGTVIHSNNNLTVNKIRLDGGVSFTGNSSGSSTIGDFWVFDATVNNNNGSYTISDSLVTNHASALIDFVGTTAVSINTLLITTLGGAVQVSGSGANDIIQSDIHKGTLDFNGTSAVNTHTINTSHANTQVTFNNGAINTCTYISMNNGQISNTTGTLNLIEAIDFTGTNTFNTGGNLILKYNSGKTARIGNLNGQTFNGQVTSEISFPAGTTGWAALGVNGITGKTLVDWDLDTPSNNGNGIPMTCTGCYWDVTIFQPTFASVCQNTLGYTPLISTDGLNQGEGYWFYLGNGYPGGPSGALTWSTKGNIISGNFSIPGASAGQGQDFLVANTYPSPIDPALFMNDNTGNVNSSTYHIYSRNCQQNIDIDPLGILCNNCACAGIALQTDPIPSGQGFFLDATGNIQFNETQKITTNQNNNPLAKQIVAPVQSKCKIQLQNGNGYDECTLYRDNRFTLNWDKPFEARKKYSSISKSHPLNSGLAKKGTIASVGIEGTDYAAQGFPFTYTNISIPMRTKVNTTGSYTITATDFGTWDGCLLLRDMVTLIEQDLTKGPYVFTINDTTHAPRFELSICSSKQTGNYNEDLNSAVQFYGHGAQTDVILNFNSPTNYKIVVSNILGQIIQHPIQGQDTQKRITIDVPLHELRFIRVEAEGKVYHHKCLGQ